MELLKLLTFRDPKLLNMALTHSSYANENPMESQDNERLEFLGDAILNFLCASYLYARYPTEAEGVLNDYRSALTDEQQLAEFALSMGLEHKIRFGKGAEKERKSRNDNLLSSAFEALVGAYYLDQGSNIDVIRPLIHQLFDLIPEDILKSRGDSNAKKRFQEWVQAKLHKNPRYEVERVGGPDHAPEFIAKVYVDAELYGTSTKPCGNKQEAEKQAAMDAIAKLGM
ncbi:Ribonuclease 3 [Tumidithrix helvetica PCC 7403]|uniref:ribonuclease III n=1 Tax=Tumidithrix helvetica TaxID=3457545 RepID=UPI003C97F1CC